MPENGPSREEDLRLLLTDAIEVQLAALRAGIGFWSEWIEQTSSFVQSATKTLASINAEGQQTKDVLLELVDAGRASVRSLTEIPRHTATRFIEELDKVQQEKETTPTASIRKPRPAGSTGSSRARGGRKTKGTAAPRRRAGRVKS